MPYCMFQAHLCRRIILSFRLNLQRNLRQAPRSRDLIQARRLKDGSEVAQSNKCASILDTPDITVTKAQENKTVSLTKFQNTLPTQMKQPSVEKKIPQYASPIPALLPSEKKMQAIWKLNDDILASPNINSVFEFYVRNKENFQLDQYILTLRRISELSKSLGSIEYIHKSKVFQSLCYDIWKATSKMETRLVLITLKSLLDMKVDNKSLIMQSLLQMARHQINIFNVKEIIFLNVLLKKTQDCNLKAAIQKAIPKLIENSINVYFPDNLKYSEIAELLRICISGKVKGLNQVLKFIHETSLPSLLEEKTSPTFNKDYNNIINSILSLNLTNCTFNYKYLNITVTLITNYLNHLVEGNFTGLDKDSILFTLSKLAYSLRNGLNSYTNPTEFLLKVVEKALEEKYDMNSLLKIIEIQLRMNFLSEELMSLVAANIQDTSILEDEKTIAAFITAMASSDLPKETSHNVLDFIMKNKKFSFDEDVFVPWIRAILSMLSIGYFNPHYLKQFLDEEFLLKSLEFMDNSPHELLHLLTLHKYLRHVKRDSNLEIPAKILSMAYSVDNLKKKSSFENFLTSIIGSENCIVSDIITPMNNFIHHIIILDGDGKPVEISKEKVEEMFEIENELSKLRKFAIIEVPKSLTTMNPVYKLRGNFKLEFQLIEYEGFTVVPLYKQELSDLKEASKYEIKNKLKKLGFNF